MNELGDELWAWQTEDAPGQWSLIGVTLPGMGSSPLITRKREVLARSRHLALEHGRALGQAVRLVRFTLDQVDEVVAAE